MEMVVKLSAAAARTKCPQNPSKRTGFTSTVPKRSVGIYKCKLIFISISTHTYYISIYIISICLM